MPRKFAHVLLCPIENECPPPPPPFFFSSQKYLLKTCFVQQQERDQNINLKSRIMFWNVPSILFRCLNLVSLVTAMGTDCTQRQVSQLSPAARTTPGYISGTKTAGSRCPGNKTKEAACSRHASCDKNLTCFLQPLPPNVTDANRILNWKQTHKRFKRTLFIRWKYNMRIFEVIHVNKQTLKQQLNGEKQWKIRCRTKTPFGRAVLFSCPMLGRLDRASPSGETINRGQSKSFGWNYKPRTEQVLRLKL